MDNLSIPVPVVKNKGGRPKKVINKGGRPSVITPIVIGKLEQAFAIDCTVEEACSYAEVSRDAFYEFLKRNPTYADKIAELRLRPVLKARQTVVTKLGENYGNAMDYLKRKKKLEFGDNVDVTSGGKPIPLFDNVSSVPSNNSNQEDTSAL